MNDAWGTSVASEGRFVEISELSSKTHDNHRDPSTPSPTDMPPFRALTAVHDVCWPRPPCFCLFLGDPDLAGVGAGSHASYPGGDGSFSEGHHDAGQEHARRVPQQRPRRQVPF